MFKHLMVLMVLAAAATSCGLDNLPVVGGDSGSTAATEAEVEILNSTESIGSAVDDTGSTAESDDAAAPASAETHDEAGDDGTAGAEEDGTSSDGTGTGTGTGDDDATPSADGTAEVLAGEADLIEGDGRMSTNPDRPTTGWGWLTIDGAHASDRFGDDAAGPGFKFVVVDYQLLGAESGNYREVAYRLRAGGESYSPSNRINEIIDPGEVFNGQLVFEVPATATDLELEAGPTADSVDGLVSVHRLTLVPGRPPVPPSVPDEAIEGTTGEISLTSAEDVMSTYPARPTQASGRLTVDRATTTARIDADGAGPDHKYLLIDFQLLGDGFGNFSDTAFRLEADGEWYSPLTGINEIIEAGEILNGTLVFLIPRHIDDVVLEGGVPDRWEDGRRATYEIWLG